MTPGPEKSDPNSPSGSPQRPRVPDLSVPVSGEEFQAADRLVTGWTDRRLSDRPLLLVLEKESRGYLEIPMKKRAILLTLEALTRQGQEQGGEGANSLAAKLTEIAKRNGW